MRRLTNSLFFIFFLLLGSGSLFSGDVDDAAKTITKERLVRWLSYLAGDECEGRGTGSEGQEKAAKMIEKIFEDSKLKKFDTLNGYRQTFNIGRYDLAQQPTFSVDGVTFKDKEDFNVTHFSGEGEVESSLVFCGFGITEPQLSYDDYANVDVKGKVVLSFRGAPKLDSKESPFKGSYYHHAYFTDKVKNAINHNAAALLIISGIEKDDKNTRFSISMPAVSAIEDTNKIPVLIITPTVARKLLDKDLKDIKEKIETDMKPNSFTVEGRKIKISVKLNKKEISTSNICGYIEGSDEYLKDRYIVIGAHYDHLGKRGNTIYYGADDNASGTTTVIALVKAFSTLNTPPKRSIIFVCFTGEEIGLLGSQHFVNKPPVPLESIDAMLNIDMVGRVPPGHSASFFGGSFLPVFENLIKKAAEKSNVKPKLTESSGYGSDHISFREKGIPSIFLIASNSTDLHTARDTPDKIPYDRMVSVVCAAFHFTYLLADHNGIIRQRIGKLPVLGLFVETTGEGITITRVLSDSPAAKATLKQGDIILALNKKETKTEENFETTLKEFADEKEITLRIRRGDTETEVKLEIPPPKPMN